METPSSAARVVATSDDAVFAALVEVSANGLAVVDEDSRILALNEAGAEILGLAGDVLGWVAPFACSHVALGRQGDRRRTAWVAQNGRRRALEYRFARMSGGRYAVWFSDVTDAVREQEHLTAITSAAASVADPCSLRATLDAVANEVHKTANIAAAQILAVEHPEDELRVLGMAGLGHPPDFTERLSACRRLGARVRFAEALQYLRPVVVLHRKPGIMADPKWAPLHEIMDRADWDSFVAMPLVARGRPLGVINAFYLPGDDPGPRSLRFLEAMADHAAVAIDTALLLAQTRYQAQSEERRRLARELHDSVVQQVFSMRLQARTLQAQLERDDVDRRQMRSVAEELGILAQSALGDLRGLVFELRPLDLAEHGLLDAVRAHAAHVRERTGLRVEVRAPADFEPHLDVHQEEDLYRTVQEAMHNVVKHARATEVAIRFAGLVNDDDWLVIEVSDNGCGYDPKASEAEGAGERSGQKSLGLVSMRERIERWGGRLEAGPRSTGGWIVEVSVPPLSEAGK
ncbi:MAG: GAF domain-containing protein [Propionibacteriales bacterium]|nr:GAF domain-containing protein [Propionibacteriales bacterium]